MHNPLHDATSQMWATAFSYFRRPTIDGPGAEWTTEDDPACTITGTDDERIAFLLKTKSMAARFGAVGRLTFEDLWNANVERLSQVYPPSPNSKSGLPYDGNSVDQALFNHLAFGFANNCDAIWRIAQRPDCLLQRQKWHDRIDNYIRPTILKAVAIPKRWRPKRNAAVAERAAPAPPVPAAPVPPSFQAPQQLAAPVSEHVTPLPPGVPPPPATMPSLEETALALHSIGASHMDVLFAGYTYVNDMDRIVGPDGFVMNAAKFEGHPRFAKKQYLMDQAASKSSDSAWKAFIQSELSNGRKVRGALFDPRQPAGAVLEQEGLEYINTWRPVPITMTPGDVEPFLTHLAKLFEDWRLLLNYLKFMMQHKGEKAMWWPFLQGVPGNGKSFISDTMEYCIGTTYTQRPTPKNIDSNFNSTLYGCLFLAIEDIKLQDDYEAFWETLKPMVTQKRLEIEYKGVDKLAREVCFNAIMNSNHKGGVKKEPDDRRLAPFFAYQQRKSDLERDGLTEAYFDRLWTWAENGGWAHVAYYLLHDPIDAGFSAKKCPVTSCTAEHILVSRSTAQQEILESVRCVALGFKGGWINLTKVNHLLDSRRNRSSLDTRRAMVEALGYVPHPGLPGGQVLTPLSDTTVPILYVLPDHTSIGLTDPQAIKQIYETANR
jgi:hypothetical protein